MDMYSPESQRFRNGDKKFPILYENNNILIYRQIGVDWEVNVVDKEKGVEMTLKGDRRGGLEFHSVGGTQAVLEPMNWPFSNFIGWSLRPRWPEEVKKMPTFEPEDGLN